MSDLMKDVDDMVRQERLMAVWNTYGNYMIGAVLALIVAVALNQGYQAWFNANARAHTRVILQATDGKDPGPALQTVAQDLTGTSAATAYILAAQDFQKNGKTAEAVAAVLAARNDARADKDIRDLATLLWVRMVAGDDAQDVGALQSALAPLMRDDNQPYAWAARIESAALAADRQDDPARAIEILTPMLNNPGLPYTQADRAKAMVQVYKTRLPKDKS
jgi:hypothetical protein